jgi:hypothetical protein
MDAGAAMRSIEAPISNGSLSQASALPDAEPEVGPKASGVRPWFRRVLHWPGTFLLLMMLMILDAGTLPRGSVGGALFGAFFDSGMARTTCRRPTVFHVERFGDSFAMIHPMLAQPPDRNEPGVVELAFWRRRDREGFWAPTRDVQTVNGWVSSPELSPGELVAAWDALADGLESLGWYDATTTGLIRAGGGRVVRPRPEGFLHNAASTILFGLLVYSARPAASRMHRYVTRVARAATGHDTDAPRTTCSGCGYPRQGLPGPVCPECGGSFEPSDGLPAAASSPARAS